MSKIKLLCILAILLFAGTNTIGIASALDMGDPDISLKMLAPGEFMPDSTYFIGIKYIVNATFWSADPAIDPEINVTVAKGEIAGNLSGRFTATSTFHECNFSLTGEIAEKRNETVVVIIKTGSSGSVDIDVTAKSHDSGNYDHIITTTNSISVPIRDLNPNGVEYFKVVAEQRKALFEQYLYLVNETLMTQSEAEKISDEGMQTALFKITSASYKMALDEAIGAGAGAFLDPLTGIEGIYDYMDFTNDAINGFEGNPLFSAVSWIFRWCEYLLGQVCLTVDIKNSFDSTWHDTPDEPLNQYISLIDEEITCWENSDFDGLKSVLDEEKGLWDYHLDYLHVSDSKRIEDSGMYSEDTKTYVKILYKSVGNSIDSDYRLIDGYIEPAIQEPSPRFVSVPSNAINLGDGDEYELVFKIKNDGGTANDSYFSLSVSDGLEITDYSSDKTNGEFTIYHKPDLIWYHDEYQIPAEYTLLDWYRPWLGAGEAQTLKVKIKGTEKGDQWVKYRLAFRPKLEGLCFVRNPMSGELDQQGWHAYKIEVEVSDVTNHKPSADFSFVVDELSVEFTSLAEDPDGDALSYYWDFDDGSSSTAENPTHEYAEGGEGDYDVTLTVTDTKGLSDYKTKVVPLNEKPKADFYYYATATRVVFVSTSTDDGFIVSWEWDFGDEETDEGETVTHTYASTGVYTATLTVTDNEGAEDSTERQISVGFFITNADATYETKLSPVSISNKPVLIKTIFISNEDVTSNRNLSAVDISTLPSPVKEIFVSNGDVILDRNLFSVNISTPASPIKEIFITNADARDYKKLCPTKLNDTTLPIITNVTVANITDNSATINWKTDEIADSLVKYGAESGIYTMQKYDSALIISHRITLTGLSAGTTYYYIVNSTDSSDNSNESVEHNFTTLTPNLPPIANFSYSPEKPVVNQTTIFNASNSTDPDGTIENYEWDFGEGNTTSTPEPIITHSYALAGDYTVNLTVTDDDGATNSTNKTITVYSPAAIFDTGSPKNPYPSIMGTHTGTIKPNHTVIATKLYTYPCIGTGGHTKYAEIWNTTWNATATWNGYERDWHNITFDKTVVLLANKTYNYTIRTGSYPKIIHESPFNATGGEITCTKFTDANGKIYYDWIPAIRLYA